MALYLRQLDALDRRRGRGRPDVTVGQLRLEAGGQAGAGSAGCEDPVPLAIEHKPSLGPVVPESKRARVRNRL